MVFRKLFGMRREDRNAEAKETDWRAQVERPCSVLEVGGFRPSGLPTASSFGEVRVTGETEQWPSFNGAPLWPVCQLNLLDAPFVPENLRDIALLQVFVARDFHSADLICVDSTDESPNSAFFVRTYKDLEGLRSVDVPDHGSTFKPFEARWLREAQMDYPTHDVMPIDFDALGIGDYYDQEGVDGVNRTKLGGWPSCIQSEPWWDYRRPEGEGFEYAFQIDSEDKAHCWWGDGGAVYVARHKTQRNLWAFDSQCF